jgi:hypothetical protein
VLICAYRKPHHHPINAQIGTLGVLFAVWKPPTILIFAAAFSLQQWHSFFRAHTRCERKIFLTNFQNCCLLATILLSSKIILSSPSFCAIDN